MNIVRRLAGLWCARAGHLPVLAGITQVQLVPDGPPMEVGTITDIRTGASRPLIATPVLDLTVTENVVLCSRCGRRVGD